jgi:uncharacterized MAPEG superfamily protein
VDAHSLYKAQYTIQNAAAIGSTIFIANRILYTMNYPVDNVEGRSMENTIVLSNNTVVNLDTSMVSIMRQP